MIDIREYLSSTSAEPKKILKVVVSISALLLVTWLLMVSRMEINGGSSGTDPAIQMRADSLRSALLPPVQPGDQEGRREEHSPGLFLNAFTTFILLIALLAAVWVWIRRSPATGDRKRYPVIAGRTLGQGAQLKVIEMNDEVWVLGITSASVNLLHRYSTEEWIRKGGEPGPSMKDRAVDPGGSRAEGPGGSSGKGPGPGEGFRRFFDFFGGGR